MFTSGHMTNMLAPMGKPAFIAVPACIEGDGGATVRLHTIDAGDVVGAATDDIEFLAAWPEDDKPLKVAAGSMRDLEKPFRPYHETSGRVHQCYDGASTTGLEIATVLPNPTSTAVVVDGLQVAYTVQGQRYVERVNVTLGMCADAPRAQEAEPEECA